MFYFSLVSILYRMASSHMHVWVQVNEREGPVRVGVENDAEVYDVIMETLSVAKLDVSPTNVKVFADQRDTPLSADMKVFDLPEGCGSTVAQALNLRFLEEGGTSL